LTRSANGLKGSLGTVVSPVRQGAVECRIRHGKETTAGKVKGRKTKPVPEPRAKLTAGAPGTLDQKTRQRVVQIVTGRIDSTSDTSYSFNVHARNLMVSRKRMAIEPADFHRSPEAYRRWKWSDVREDLQDGDLIWASRCKPALSRDVCRIA